MRTVKEFLVMIVTIAGAVLAAAAGLVAAVAAFALPFIILGLVIAIPTAVVLGFLRLVGLD